MSPLHVVIAVVAFTVTLALTIASAPLTVTRTTLAMTSAVHAQPAPSAAHTQPAESAAPAPPVRLIGLDEQNTFVRFDSERPADTTMVKVTGVRDAMVGIDFRPANGRLYTLSSANNLYTVDPASGAATLVSTLLFAFDGGPDSGFDFNPQADRLRLAGRNGQNLRVNVDIGAVATDGQLAYAPKDRHVGAKPALAASAYTSAIANAPATKLFNIDSELDVLTLQEPPNDGVLVTIGPLGVDFGSAAGFDIVTDGAGDHGFAASGSALYAIDLGTGTARRLGTIGAGNVTLVGLTAIANSDTSAAK